MADHKRGTKINMPMIFAAFLFCATLISIHFTSGLYARYTTSGEGSDSARVVTFGDITISETGDFEDDGTLIIIPGVNLIKKAVVDFEGSEASTYVFVEVILPEDVWTTQDNQTFAIKSDDTVWMQWDVDAGWTYLTKETDTINKTETYIYYRELAPNTSLSADIIAVLDPNKKETILVSDEITKTDITTLTDIFLEFKATAVQSHGFENAAAAWNSVGAK